MNKNINLYEILKGHEGETFYSPIYGNLTHYPTLYPLVRFKTVTGAIFDINANGKVYENSDELFVFPSKDQRDWNKWIEEQKPKIPKTWNEIVIDKYSPVFDICLRPVHNGNYQNYHYEITYGNSSIEKSALALFKIHQLIEVGYGGNVINEDYINNEWKYTIIYSSSSCKLEIIETCHYRYNNIAFHTEEQAKEFLSKSENVQLLKDYFMI